MSDLTFKLPPFDGKSDFYMWKKKIKCVLILQGLFGAIDLKYSGTETEQEKSKMNDSALATIILNLSDAVIRKVYTIESAKELWDKLDELYKPSTWSYVYLLKSFFSFKLDLSKDMDANLDVFYKLVFDIKMSGDFCIDKYTAHGLLNAFPESYNDVKSAIQYGRDDKDITLDVVANALKWKEFDLKHGSSGKNETEIMHMGGRKQNSSCSHSGGKKNSNPRNRLGKNKNVQEVVHANMVSCSEDVVANLDDYHGDVF